MAEMTVVITSSAPSGATKVSSQPVVVSSARIISTKPFMLSKPVPATPKN